MSSILLSTSFDPSLAPTPSFTTSPLQPPDPSISSSISSTYDLVVCADIDDLKGAKEVMRELKNRGELPQALEKRHLLYDRSPLEILVTKPESTLARTELLESLLENGAKVPEEGSQEWESWSEWAKECARDWKLGKNGVNNAQPLFRPPHDDPPSSPPYYNGETPSNGLESSSWDLQLFNTAQARLHRSTEPSDNIAESPALMDVNSPFPPTPNSNFIVFFPNEISNVNIVEASKENDQDRSSSESNILNNNVDPPSRYSGPQFTSPRSPSLSPSTKTTTPIRQKKVRPPVPIFMPNKRQKNRSQEEKAATSPPDVGQLNLLSQSPEWHEDYRRDEEEKKPEEMDLTMEEDEDDEIEEISFIPASTPLPRRGLLELNLESSISRDNLITILLSLPLRKPEAVVVVECNNLNNPNTITSSRSFLLEFRSIEDMELSLEVLEKEEERYRWNVKVWIKPELGESDQVLSTTTSTTSSQTQPQQQPQQRQFASLPTRPSSFYRPPPVPQHQHQHQPTPLTAAQLDARGYISGLPPSIPKSQIVRLFEERFQVKVQVTGQKDGEDGSHSWAIVEFENRKRRVEVDESYFPFLLEWPNGNKHYLRMGRVHEIGHKVERSLTIAGFPNFWSWHNLHDWLVDNVGEFGAFWIFDKSISSPHPPLPSSSFSLFQLHNTPHDPISRPTRSIRLELLYDTNVVHVYRELQGKFIGDVPIRVTIDQGWLRNKVENQFRLKRRNEERDVRGGSGGNTLMSMIFDENWQNSSPPSSTSTTTPSSSSRPTTSSSYSSTFQHPSPTSSSSSPRPSSSSARKDIWEIHEESLRNQMRQ